MQETASVLYEKLEALEGQSKIASDSFILFVDDGSVDQTWLEIEQLHSLHPQCMHGIRFAHNKGHQNAVYAGLMKALGMHVDAAISMDADLQDDPNAIEEMVMQYREGSQIVYGVRNNRDTDSAFKRGSAHSFYRLMNWMGAETIPDHADFRLMGQAALSALSQYNEVNLFLRGIVPSLGFQTSKVYYKRSKRVAGESKYPLKKMVSLAIEGLTSFSVKPLSFITALGGFSVVIGIIMFIYTIVSVSTGHAVAGWGSLMCSIWLLGGLILMCLGIVGEYIGRIYLEVKNRPRYIIEQEV
ncbi:glycosyl transferase [Bombiscardovia nodaiensis]|uniref:Glycosyl transferase n=1 Tax=Bombiscardovia nodaiensis TaxID=2932181 RepID=A0ABM8B9R7_9BIFI|nr:glycosyl transferase [Bombiscardovia nodaiensis]